jgi:hypothetical protein
LLHGATCACCFGNHFMYVCLCCRVSYFAQRGITYETNLNNLPGNTCIGCTPDTCAAKCFASAGCKVFVHYDACCLLKYARQGPLIGSPGWQLSKYTAGMLTGERRYEAASSIVCNLSYVTSAQKPDSGSMIDQLFQATHIKPVRCAACAIPTRNDGLVNHHG